LYPGGGSHYVRHMDASKGRAESRLLTFVYYANPDWVPAQGGQLRVFFADGSTRTVEPIADRLIVFQSRSIEHEVMDCFADRAAVSSWFCLHEDTE
jgi:SM-20-related protein